MKKCDICGHVYMPRAKTQKRCSKECSATAKNTMSSKRVSKRRQQNSKDVKFYLGGKCCVCSYERCSWALEAHHVNDKDKKFALSVDGSTRSIRNTLVEANKCVLLCANCHREYHSGLISKSILSEILKSEQSDRKRRAETIIGVPKQTPTCNDCGVEVSNKNRCKKCGNKSREKIDWPSTDVLIAMVDKSTLVSVGNELGVSDTAVKKRIRNHQ